MDDPNITMEEYIKLEEENARKRGTVFNWETAKYGKIGFEEDIHDLRSIETKLPAIVFNDNLTFKETLPCEPTVSFLNDNKIDFRISYDESKDEDYTILFGKNSFSYKIISTNDLKTDSENNSEEVNIPLFPSPKPTVSCIDNLDFFKNFENEFPTIIYNDALTSKSYFSTEPTVGPQHIDEFDLKSETSLFECDEEEQNIICFNDLFSFNVIYPDDSKSDKDNDVDKIDIKQSLEDNVINTDVGAYAHGSNKLFETSTTSRDLWLSLKKAYAPHSTSREYTLKTQLLRIEMHDNETLNAYLNRAQEYADALTAIDDPIKDKDLVMLAVSGLHEEYNGFKTTITACQSPTAFSELHALLSDHDYMLGKTRAPAPSTTSSFAANYAVGSPSMPEACQAQISELTAQLSALGFQVSPIAPSDTGANSHVTPDLEAMDNSEAYYGDDALHVGNGKGLPILHIGSSKVYSPQKTFSLKNILHVPEISHNLLSVQKFCHDNDVFFEFHTSYFVVKDESTHTTLLTGPSKHGLYTITLPQLKSINKVSFSVVRASPTIWHRRLGHPHQRLLRSMLSNFSLPVTNKSLSSFCNSCPLGKSSKLPLFESGFRTQKSDVYSTFKSFVQMVERQVTTKLNNVQTDWGGKFRNLASFFSSLGIIHRRSCPHTSEQNGFVECRNHHVMETGFTLLAQACVPQRFWHYASDTAVYLINRMPSRTSTNKSPFEHIFKRSPDYYFLPPPIMDIVVLIYLPSVFILLDIPSSPRSLISSPSSVSHLSPTSQTSLESSNGQPSPVSTTLIPTPPPPTPPPPTPPPPPPPPITRQCPANLHQNPKQRVPYNPFANHATVLPTTITEPTSFTIANNSPKWCQAIKEEYDALMKNGTWSLVPRASNTNVVDGKWVYKLKRDKNGAITRYKARFVAKGFQQQPGIDFHDTFSLVVKSTTIRAVLLLAVTNNWPLCQLDIHNAFLHGNLKEQVTIDNIICQLVSAFALKDIGPLNYFLGIEIVPHVSSILLSQKKYILELLQSAEAEYKALADTIAELKWLQALLNELGICSSLTPILWAPRLQEYSLRRAKGLSLKSHPLRPRDLTFMTSDEGMAKTTPRPEGSLGEKYLRGNIPPDDMEPINPTVADLSYVRAILLSEDEAQETEEDILGADKPTSSTAPHTKASDTDSSSDKIIKKYDDTLPLTEQKLLKYLRKVDQTDKLVEASMSSFEKSSTIINDLYKGLNVITKLLKDILLRLSQRSLPISLRVLGLERAQNHIKSSMSSLQEDISSIKSMMTEMYNAFRGQYSSAPSGSVALTLALTHISANVEGENATHTATKELPSHTEGGE
ncbi:putative RNA-directed DNA polymerase [Tanacetum coccineum]